MLTLVVWVRKLEGFTQESFTHYWRNNHAPLVRSVPEFMRHVRKYAQYHVAAELSNPATKFGDLADYDGVGALWFENRKAMEDAFAEPRYLEIIRPDEQKFIDAARCVSFLSHEFVAHSEVDGGG